MHQVIIIVIAVIALWYFFYYRPRSISKFAMGDTPEKRAEIIEKYVKSHGGRLPGFDKYHREVPGADAVEWYDLKLRVDRNGNIMQEDIDEAVRKSMQRAVAKSGFANQGQFKSTSMKLNEKTLGTALNLY